jgi:hypothetical protein
VAIQGIAVPSDENRKGVTIPGKDALDDELIGVLIG